VVLGFLLAAAFVSRQGIAAPETDPKFETDILPIFQANCVQCHGDKVKMKELNVSTFVGISKGGESGQIVTPGKPDESRLYQLVRDGKMPFGGKKLSDSDIERIRAWIETGALSTSSHADLTEAAPLTQHDIIPIMLSRCTVCHGLRKQDGGLALHTRAAILKGGKSGPVIVAVKPDESLLIKKIRSGEMPPRKLMLQFGIVPITDAETDRVAKWIAAGAPEGDVQPDVAGNGPDPLVSEKDKQFWAFQSPRPVAVPKVRHAGQVRNPVDAFLLAKLEEKNLAYSPETDRATLIRRASFDLTGLPPEPKEAEAFLADKDPQAYEKLIDRLLASPRYGERWGRVWLDLAGYADSEGLKVNSDRIRPQAFRYRDYVIRSMNADKPYNRFLLEQIAGDELSDYEHASVVTAEMMDNLVATGYLRMGPDSTNERDVDFAIDRLDVIGDEIDVLSSSVMGLTIKCARCHSHKYDPIPQRDYYRLADVFKGAFDEHDWIRPLAEEKYGLKWPGRYLPYITPGATPVQLMEEEKQRQQRIFDLQKEIESLQGMLAEKAAPLKKKVVDQRLEELPRELREDLRGVIDTAPDKRTEAQKYLANKFEKQLKVEIADLKKLDPAFRKEAREIEKKIKLVESSKPPAPQIRALFDRGEPSPTYILKRGNPTSFGRLVGPGVPAVLTDLKSPFVVEPPWPGAKSTGRRLALARWLIQPDHPLTARVMVNRIWKHHFGTGIVKTVANFGKTGAQPTHPELLDWLAVQFVRGGWSMKAMHRLIMTSTAYRQVATRNPALDQQYPDNALLSRMPLRRMEAEQLNDTLALVAGRLDETPFGPATPVEVREDGLVSPIPTEKGWRRSIYILQRRRDIPTILESFDLPPMNPNCVERVDSNVALQALYLMNDDMVRLLADGFAERVKREAGADPQRQIDRVYWIALSRPPTENERKASLETLAGLGKQASREDDGLFALAKLCHAALNSAAFLYID
jgi:mono/diheme cytochrome c family protein